MELIAESFYSLDADKIFPKDKKNKANGIRTVWDKKIRDKSASLAAVTFNTCY